MPKPLPPCHPARDGRRAFGAACESGVAVAAVALLGLAPLGAWIAYSGPGLLLVGGTCSALLWVVGRRTWRAGRHRAAGGILVAAAAVLVPFAVHGLEHTIQFFPATPLSPRTLSELVRHPAFAIDASAVAALALAAWRTPFPPLGALLTGAAWLAAIDAAPIFFGEEMTWSADAVVAAAVGVAALAAGVVADLRARRRFAGWVYAAGLLLVCGAVATLEARGTAAVLAKTAFAFSLVLLGLLLRRRVFAVFGAISVAGAVGRLAADVVDGPALLAAAALVAIAVGWGAAAYARVEEPLAGAVRERLPRWLRRRLPPLIGS